MHRRQDGGDAVLGAPADRALGGGERLEDRRVRLLQGLGHHADRLQDAVLDALAPFGRGLERPGRLARRDPPELALEGEHLLGPGLLDDGEALLEGFAVGGVDLVVLVGERAVDAVRLLRHDVDPAALVAAREAGAGPPARHVVEHGDVLGDADRIGGRQHDAELAHLDALGLHGDEEVEQDGVVGDLEALDVEVVLGEAHGLVAELVGQPALLRHLAQHLLVEVGPRARHARLDVGLGAERGQIEQGHLHASLAPFRCCSLPQPAASDPIAQPSRVEASCRRV